MKSLKWVLLSLLSLLLLVFIVAGIMLYTLDPNEHKTMISEQVKTATGRDLNIKGDIQLSLFPWLGFELGEISLSNAAGFGDAPFVKLRGAQLKLALLPLLKQQIKIDRIELIGFELELARNAAGVNNWDDLSNTNEKPVEENSEPLSLESLGIDIQAVLIENAKLHWSDATTQSDLRINDLSLKLGRLQLGEDFPLELSFKLANQQPAMTVALHLNSQVNLDLNQQQYRLSALQLNINAQGAELPNGAVSLHMNADLLANLHTESLKLKVAELQLAGVNTSLSVEIEKRLQNPQIKGLFTLHNTDLRQVLTDLKLPLPEMADNSTLSAISAQIPFQFDGKKLHLSQLKLQLDQSQLSGNLTLGQLDAALPEVQFQLNMSALNADRYLPPPSETKEPEMEQAADGDAPIELPLELLRQLNIDGSFELEQLIISNLKLAHLQLGIKAKKGQIALQPLNLDLYEGNLKASAKLDARQNTPRYHLQSQLTNLSSGPLLKDFLDNDFLLGHGDVILTVKTSGNSVNALKKALNGDTALAFKNGAINGFNLAQSLRKAKAKLSGKSFTETEFSKTDFTALTVSATIKNGVVSSNDLDLRSPLLRVSGKGNANLVSNQLDYTAEIKITNSTSGQGGKSANDLAGLNIPIRASGPFDDVGIEFLLTQALAGKKLDAAKNKLNDAVAEQKQAVKKQQQALQQKKQAAEEKARAEAQRALKEKQQQLQQEAEQKLKNLLKF
ncbi:MAG: AsmA family protein [Gammaproteobacteria bacterium]|nr:AsmA family protein [Gammaproteobacteria bacterium]